MNIKLSFTPALQKCKSALICIIKYLLFAFGLSALFSLILYLSGLCSTDMQRAIVSNTKASVEQFLIEGEYPKVFSDEDHASRLDNHTDSIILQQSLFMDTRTNPVSVLYNPYISKSYHDEEHADRLLALKEAAETGTSNYHYAYYWIGMRALVRPLLMIMNYQQIRGFIFMLFAGLFLITTCAVCKRLGKHYAAAMFISLACINIPVAASTLQFIPCFFVMFLSVLALIRFEKNERWIAPLFFVTGACTQFLDFYTYPLITLGFPLLILLGMNRNHPVRKQAALMLRCIVAWFSAYLLLWLLRMLLVEWFTDLDQTFEKAFSRFSKWTGNNTDPSLARYTPEYTLDRNFRTLLQPHVKAWLNLSGVSYIVIVLCAAIKRHIQKPVWLMLPVGLLPLIWLSAASTAAGSHHWFQYRCLSVFVFAVFSFIISSLSGKEKDMIHPD